MRLVYLDQSLMAKNSCFKRRDDLATADAAAAAVHARTTTTTLSTPHAVAAPDHQSLAPAQVSNVDRAFTTTVDEVRNPQSFAKRVKRIYECYNRRAMLRTARNGYTCHCPVINCVISLNTGSSSSLK